MRRFLYVYALLFGFASCGLKDFAGNISVCDSGATRKATQQEHDLFDREVLPAAQNNCASCHNTRDPKIGTWWEIVDRVKVKAVDGHCGGNCSEPNEMSAALKRYFELNKESGENSSECQVVGETVEADVYSTNSHNFVTLGPNPDEMDFPFVIQGGGPYEGLIIEVTVYRSAPVPMQPDTVVIKEVRVHSIPGVDFNIGEMRFVLNGTPIASLTLKSISKDILSQSGTSTSEVFTTSATTIRLEPGIDSLRISAKITKPKGFKLPAPPNTGPALAFFNANCDSILVQRCSGCHDGGNIYNLSRGTVENELATRQRVVAGNPAASLVLVRAYTGTAHPPGPVLPQADRDTIAQWIDLLAQP